MVKNPGLKLKLLRITRGIRQYDLAIRVGIAPNRLSEIESGRRQPSLDLLEALRRALQWSGSENSGRPDEFEMVRAHERPTGDNTTPGSAKINRGADDQAKE